MRDGGCRGARADPPARCGGNRAFGIDAAAQEDGERASGLCSEMEAAGGGQGKPDRNLGHHPGQAGVAQTFFHGHQGSGMAGFSIDDPVRMQSGCGQGRGEQVLLLKDPKDRAGSAGQDAGGEESGCGGEFAVDPDAADLVQGRDG